MSIMKAAHIPSLPGTEKQQYTRMCYVHTYYSIYILWVNADGPQAALNAVPTDPSTIPDEEIL